MNLQCRKRRGRRCTEENLRESCLCCSRERIVIGTKKEPNKVETSPSRIAHAAEIGEGNGV